MQKASKRTNIVKRTPILLGLLVVFLISGIVNYAVLMHFSDRIDPQSTDFSDIFGAIARIHSVYIGLILGGIFAKKRIVARVPWTLTVTAFVLAIAWSVFVATSWHGFPTTINTNGLINHLNQNAQTGAVLVAGALAYLLGSDLERLQGKRKAESKWD